MSGIFFILGAGASVDSGLPTYRGSEGLYTSIGDYNKVTKFLSIETPLQDLWSFMEPLYKSVNENLPGKTYKLIKEIGGIINNSFILTQNIDGNALSTGLPIVEIHGDCRTMYCIDKRCPKGCYQKLIPVDNEYKCECGATCRPNVVLFGESLDQRKIMQVYTFIKRGPKYIVIIGTSLQFPYLEVFISKAKQRGSEVIHINPDPEYSNNIGKHEEWLMVNSSEGLEILVDRFKKELENE